MEDRFTVIILLNATPAWLSLSREDRDLYFRNEIVPIFERYQSRSTIRFFDSEFFHAHVSDYILVETSGFKDYQYLMEELRDTKIYSVPYFEVKDIITGIENAFQSYNDETINR